MKKQLLVYVENSELNNQIIQLITQRDWQINIVLIAELIPMQLSQCHYDVFICATNNVSAEHLTLIAKVRQRFHLPIIWLNQSNLIEDNILAYRVGVDSVINLPCDAEEFVLKTEAIIRRSSQRLVQQKQSKVLNINGIYLNPAIRQVFCNNVEIDLTSKEFNLLHLLMQKAGEAVAKEALCSVALCHSPLSRVLDVHICNIRKKLAKVTSNEKFKSVRGVGYIFLYSKPQKNTEKRKESSDTYVSFKLINMPVRKQRRCSKHIGSYNLLANLLHR